MPLNGHGTEHVMPCRCMSPSPLAVCFLRDLCTSTVNISSCTAMSTNLKTLYLDAIWLKYQGP